MSSVIQRALYNETTQTLAVTFKTGRTYVYEDVPREIYAAFMAAPSQGAFFNASIRDAFYMHELE